MPASETKASPYFTPIPLSSVYNRSIARLTPADCSDAVLQYRRHLLTGRRILCGIPFELGGDGEAGNVLLVRDGPVEFTFPRPFRDPYLVFLHAADFKPGESGPDGITPHHMGEPRLGEPAAVYVLRYDDGTEHPIEVRRRFHISEFRLRWGSGSFECIPHTKPQAFRTNTDDMALGKTPSYPWGPSQSRSFPGGEGEEMFHWLWAAENPHPEKALRSVTFVPKDSSVFVFGMSGCGLAANPIRWGAAKRLKLTLPDGDEPLELEDVDIDLGAVVSVFPLREYDNDGWEAGYANNPPGPSARSFIVEYTAHPNAILYLGRGRQIRMPLEDLGDGADIGGYRLRQAAKPGIPVRVRIVGAGGRPVAAKLHIHSAEGEYLAPMNRHRFPNPHWFEDYSVDYANGGHFAAYVDGDTVVKLPEGDVFIEVTKGFEVKPVRCRRTVTPDTRELVIELAHVLPWREKGWVTADTHVHFLSPHSALLEGTAEGVNVVNLLASQWGELFTNMGDFDGATTLGSREAGGSGEYLVRVGTENRQHILGHISLLGYEGSMILPLTTGGSDESRLGDPVECTLIDWATQCRGQKGLSILPHFPNPRAEGAAAIALELIDGVEMTSWGSIFEGISPYSLSDWYRYLNCGYFVPAVGGTDKMSADTPVGGVRTYALIEDGPFTYDAWKDAVRRGLTFATYGPLLDFRVNGQRMGGVVQLPEDGGTVDIDWQVSSVVIPATAAELVVNGELRERTVLDPARRDSAGHWSLKMEGSGWAALRVRGRHPDRSEVIAAHSSAVAVKVGDKPILNALDAMTILDQIEGARAYVKNLGSTADESAFRRIVVNLAAAHRALHNRLHQMGVFHNHTAVDDHHGHHN